MARTIQELKMLQSLPLDVKIGKTKQRIREWVDRYGIDGVYVSFSGVKDSTVLLHIARNLYPNIKAVFVDTGLEYPEIRNFVKTFDNVDWLKPQMTFREVIEKYGYPFISKEVSECVYGARKYVKRLDELNNVNTILTDRQTDNCRIGIGTIELSDKASMRELTRGGKIISIVNLEDLENIQKPVIRFLKLLGKLTVDNKILKENTPSQDRSMFSQERYKFFLKAPFEISSKCCDVMKKSPVHTYARKTKRMPITAQMSAESRLRTQHWLNNGCNGFDMKNPISNPMSFWTEQDVLQYILDNNIEICSVYGDIVIDYQAEGQIEGQMSLSDMGFFEQRHLLKTTGCNRTGCMFCGYGCHLEKSPNRFERMKETHPKIYEYIMKSWDKGGLGYKEIIDWINERGNMNIKY